MERSQLPPITAGDTLKALFLLAIPTILAAIYYLTPLSFQQSLALDQTQPRIHNFWTNALVHNHRPGDRHLTGNIVGYLLLVFPCWILYIFREQERQFWNGLAIILTFGPFIISASSYIAYQELLGLQIESDRGFSGVVGALAGFLLMSIHHTFAQKQEEPVALLSMGLYFGYMMLGLGVLTSRILAIGLGLLILGGMYASTRTQYTAPPEDLAEWASKNGWLSLILLIAIIVSVLGFAVSFPADITSGSDGFTNIVAHGAGILVGLAVASSLWYRTQQTNPHDTSAA